MRLQVFVRPGQRQERTLQGQSFATERGTVKLLAEADLAQLGIVLNIAVRQIAILFGVPNRLDGTAKSAATGKAAK